MAEMGVARSRETVSIGMGVYKRDTVKKSACATGFQFDKNTGIKRI